MNILKNMLRWKKVLFTIDDVNHQEQLEFWVGEPEWYEKEDMSDANVCLSLILRHKFQIIFCFLS